MTEKLDPGGTAGESQYIIRRGKNKSGDIKKYDT